ncbi:disulfide bond formation protein D precursor [bacterium BMS3Abin13]|nr:disulfide bond formation protein D precursor [bacterium BMS3Abin13]
MKKTLVLCFLLLLPAWLYAGSPPPTTQSGSLDWSVLTTWKMATKPLAFVQTLDNRRVYVLGADSKVHIFSSANGRELGAIPVDKAVTAIDIAPRGERLYLLNPKDKTFTSIAVDFTVHIDVTGSPFLGNAKAPVTLVLFSDFQCPYCHKLQPLLHQVLQRNPNTVKIVFKNLPLPMHKMAQPAALAALAAQAQGKFWPMHDALFALDKLSPETINGAAQKIGLDMEQFKKDLGSQKIREKLTKDLIDADRAEVHGTPTLFVNGRLVRNRSFQAVQLMINHALAQVKKGATN